MKLEIVQGIFFDFDGVILNSTSIKTETFRNMFSEFGDEIEKKVTEHHLAHGGISRVEKISTYYAEFLNQPLSELELMEKCTEFSNRVKDRVVASQWIPGAESFLQKHHRRFPLFVVSGTPIEELTEIVERRNMSHYFKRVLGSPIKKPIHIKQLADEYEFNLDRCIFIGDAMTDYHAAKETGTPFIGIEGFCRFPEGTVVLPNCSDLEQAIADILPTPNR